METSIIKQYQDEITYLQSLLDANGIPYDYEAYSKAQNKAGQQVVELMPLDIFPEMAKFFFSMFHGRVDVYARRSKDKGYFPECSNFWTSGICPKKDKVKIKCAECSARAYAVLNSKVLMQHFKGDREDCTDVLGVYVMLKENMCRFIVFDFDDHNGESDTPEDWQKEVDTMRDICRMCGIDCLVERSRSGHGAHVWIFFSEAIPAEKARKFGNALITKGAEFISVNNFRYYDRLLPMQDALQGGGLGNLIALPWQGRAEKQGIGHFIYPRFTRLVDLSENITITEALSLVARDELRNLQIVADVKECIRLGRTPIVMTKRKDHAAILYDMLKGEARHTFLLQGGGSMKERAALREKMAAVPSVESMLAVAIGQYIGEGFNYPRLDTLLLAMSISFEGNVEQYAGRLNRDYEGKKGCYHFRLHRQIYPYSGAYVL